MNELGKISKIQHFSLGDGPGIRTTVFLQGCNLRCPWCHNPETVSFQGSHLCYEMKCSVCGLCAAACPQKAISIQGSQRIVNQELCVFCGMCENVCPQNAVLISGKEVTREFVFEEIMKDFAFYDPSGGGVTFSGGEPLIQADFVSVVARLCKENGIHTIVDTVGCVPFANFEKIMPYTDKFFYDIKACDAEQFRKVCGGDFSLVLSNLTKLAECADVTVRMPVIPRYNDHPDYMDACGRMLAACGVKHADLIPFHRMGSSKYQALGMCYAYDRVKPPEDTRMETLRETVEKYAIVCNVER